jgi:hypothetical protein
LKFYREVLALGRGLQQPSHCVTVFQIVDLQSTSEPPIL